MKSRRWVAIACAIGTAAAGIGAVEITGSSVAGAMAVSKTFVYNCVFPIVGSENVHVTVNADFPQPLNPGENTGKIPVSATITLDSSALSALSSNKIKAVSGSVKARVTVASPDGSPTVFVSLNIPSTPVPDSGFVTLNATGTLPDLRFTNSGTITVSVGDASAVLIPEYSDTSIPAPGVLNQVPCTLTAGQDPTFAVFQIGHGPTPTPAPPTPSPTLAPTPSPTVIPPTPTPSATPAPPTPPIYVNYKFTFDGTSFIKAANATVPVKASIDATLNLRTNGITADLAMADTGGTLLLLGFLPITTHIGFQQVGQTTGTLFFGALTTHSTMNAKFSFNLFGLPIGGGDQCRTATPFTVTLKSTQASFKPLQGGPVTGGYDLPQLTNCGLFTPILSGLVSGPGNTAAATVSPAS